MRNTLLLLTIIFFCLASCMNNKSEKLISYKKTESIDSPLIDKSANEYPFKSYNLYNDFKFYEDIYIRGVGIIYFEIIDGENNELKILNKDKTVFGTIVKKDGTDDFDINLPKEITARYIVINFEGFTSFTFDAEEIDLNSKYLTIYINGEPKLIEKSTINYTFQSWEEYINDVFIELTAKVQNSTEIERYNLYKVLEVKKDSLFVKSIPESTTCYLVDSYEDVTKWVRWKDDNNCKFINFIPCF